MTDVRLCCSGCFGDRQIREQYIDQCDPVVQTCDYCGETEVPCVAPSRLGSWFSALMATYEETANGTPLIQLLRDEWGLFADSGLVDAAAKELLADVLDDGEFVRRSYAPIVDPSLNNLRSWEDLRDELMHQNRWFLADPMDMDRIRELLDYLIAPQSAFNDGRWYRARLLSNGRAFDLEEMGAPPPHLAGHGRANPVGIPYLYLGSTPGTAVAELRPHTGEQASVAEFGLPANGLKLADLRNPRALISPLLGDEAEIIKLRADLPLLERLGEELTRPVQVRGAPYEYVPTQYLCEFIKTCGFHGVLYRSSVTSDSGINVALFQPDLAHALSVQVAAVEQVTVRISY